tara:strand:- start:613 stop:1536 length:924 start_codon:yes stop_codon:yes gene_type:complete
MTLRIILFFFFINISTNLVSANIEIKYKINNDIITNTDIDNEKNYLLFIRPSLKSLSDKEIIKISENSLIREIIKKNELNEVFDVNEADKYINKVKKNLYRFTNINNENDLKKLLKRNNIEYENIIEKMKYESLWNELIFRKFNSLVKLNENKLRTDLELKIKNNKKYEYNLSELLFELNKTEKVYKTYEDIIDYVKLNNFKSAAFKYSIANSSKSGGEIGWVKETLLSKDLNDKLKKLKKNEITEPIKYPNGYLILKINDKREMKQIVNFDEEYKDLVNFEKNKQLNQFSILFYKKLKQNSKINAY